MRKIRTSVRERERNYATSTLLTDVDDIRRRVSKHIDKSQRAVMGQFLTPVPVARFLARMFEAQKPVLHVLDPGAGVGALSAAFVAEMCLRKRRPKTIIVTAYEIDSKLISHLQATLDLCHKVCAEADIAFKAHVLNLDFIEAGVRGCNGDLFAARSDAPFDCAILNPPYRKIRTESRERKLLRNIGIETSNLYTGFLALTALLLAPGGEMVAITPRSFCNGPYFEPFRRFFLRTMRFRHVHVFESRDRAFADDEVLQENIVFRADKISETDSNVVVSSSVGPNDQDVRSRTILYSEFVRPMDPHSFIHIVPDPNGDSIRQQIRKLKVTLSELGIEVSTGRVVDFRAKDLLRSTPEPNTVPLIYPCHFKQGYVEWPNGQTRKPNAFSLGLRSEDLLVPTGHYVLVKRFSSKEEPRRVVAAVYDPLRIVSERVAFENHLNYFHMHGSGLPVTVAKGLAAFLNSTLVDTYFRQFSGHTQVNATDLRSLCYPTWEQLVALGRRICHGFPAQDALDRLVEEVAFDG